jgi:fatty acid desaturase
MKTITEYRPMIFSLLAAHSEQHARRRRQLGIELLAVAGYGVLGLWLSFDTGFAPWQWQFWLMFAPLFVAGELAWRTLLPTRIQRMEN